MDDKEPASTTGNKISGWLKALLGTIGGVLIGAISMNATALLDRVIKPAKPLANFAVDHEGTSVTFHNRSSGLSTGWWDFGDGSPLEPVSPKQDVVVHQYPSAGDFTARLKVNNLLGEESERTVTVHIDSAQAQAVPPEISSLDVVPISPEGYAPATFRVSSKVKNAQVCVWDYGEPDALPEVTTDDGNNQDKFVTFKKPGGYLIKLVACNGTKYQVKSDIVNVQEAPAGTITAILNVTDQGTHVKTVSTPYTFSETFPAQLRDSTYSMDRQVPVKPGFTMADVRLPSGVSMHQQGKTEMMVDAGLPGVRDLKLSMAADQHSARLTGQLVKDVSKNAPAPQLTFPVVLVEEKRTSASRPAVPVTATLSASGTIMLTLPPLPADWVEPHRQLRLELRDGDRVVLQESQLPRGLTVTLHNRLYKCTATPVGDQVRVDLVEVRAGVSAAAN